MGMRTSKFMHWQVKGGVHILASQRAISTLIIFTGAIYLHEFQSPHRSINYHKHILYGYMWLYVLGSPIFFFLFYLIHLPVLFPWWIFNAWGRGRKPLEMSETARQQNEQYKQSLFQTYFSEAFFRNHKCTSTNTRLSVRASVPMHRWKARQSQINST